MGDERTGKKNPETDKSIDSVKQPGGKADSAKLLEDFLAGKPIFPEGKSPLVRLETLFIQRHQLENALSETDRKNLNQVRLDLSKTPEQKEEDRLKESLAKQFPELAKKNKEIEDELSLGWSMAVGPPATGRSWRSAIQCHQPNKDNSFSRLSPSYSLPAQISWQDMKYFQSAQDSWYKPFASSFQLSRTYGVDLHLSSDSFPKPYFSICLNQTEKKLSVDMQKELQEQLHKLAEDKIKELETKYGVEFSHENEEIVKSLSNGSDSARPVVNGVSVVRTRRPYIDELYGVEEALRVSESTTALKNESGFPLKICFLKEEDQLNSTKAAGQYWQDLRGRPTIVMYSGAERRQVTNSPTETLNQNLSVKEIAVHELAHYSQDLDKQNWASMSPSIEFGEKMGWKSVSEEKGGWILKCKNGEFYRADTKNFFAWYRCSEQGDPLDAAGKPVKELTEAQKLEAAKVRDLAVIKPASGYFNRPTEMFAEALTAFRSGTDWRRRLLRESPELYEIAKKHDQNEIDRYYNEKFGGKSGLRLPDGSMVEASEKAKKDVALFECEQMRIAIPDLDINRLGWKKVSGLDSDSQWIIKGKDNNFYRPEARYEGVFPGWHRCNRDGKYLDGKGNLVDSSGEAERKEDQRIRELALVTPLSGRYSTPEEMLKTAHEEFTKNLASRANLLFQSQDLYDAAQRYDRLMLDNYEKLSQGKPVIRLPDGSIAEATDETRNKVRAFESENKNRSLAPVDIYWLGWKEIPGSGEPSKYMIRCRNNTFYRLERVNNQDAWCQCDENGKYLDGTKKIVDSAAKASNSGNWFIRSEALVEPLTESFVTPQQVLNSAYQEFIRDKESRTNLLLKSEDLYGAATRYDRYVLHDYEKLNQGKPYSRLPDGSIVETTPEAMRQIFAFEREIKKSKK